MTLAAAVVFYVVLVPGRTGQWSLAVLLIPGVILHARRLHDMGHTAWLLLAPALLMIAAFAIRLRVVSFGAPLDSALPTLALAVCAAFALWGCLGRGHPDANRFGGPATA
jgi:uncharacterized membrane protein YhaH (DUF805 family)